MGKERRWVERPVVPIALDVSTESEILADPSAHAVKVYLWILVEIEQRVTTFSQVTLQRLDVDDEDSMTEIVRAKFVLGADGGSTS